MTAFASTSGAPAPRARSCASRPRRRAAARRPARRAPAGGSRTPPAGAARGGWRPWLQLGGQDRRAVHLRDDADAGDGGRAGTVAWRPGRDAGRRSPRRGASRRRGRGWTAGAGRGGGPWTSERLSGPLIASNDRREACPRRGRPACRRPSPAASRWPPGSRRTPPRLRAPPCSRPGRSRGVRERGVELLHEKRVRSASTSTIRRAPLARRVSSSMTVRTRASRGATASTRSAWPWPRIRCAPRPTMTAPPL